MRPTSPLQPDIAYAVMSYGIRHGSFAGKQLSGHITGDRCD